jgi:hypothetical protein
LCRHGEELQIFPIYGAFLYRRDADKTPQKADRPQLCRENYAARYRVDLLLVIEDSREKRRKVVDGTKGNETNRADGKVTEGRERSKRLEKTSGKWKEAAGRQAERRSLDAECE